MHGDDKLKNSLRDIERAEFSQKFSVGDAFFSSLEQNEIIGGDVEVSLKARCLAGEIYRLDFSFSGAARVQCDRCLDELEIAIEGEDFLKLCYEDNELAEEINDVDVVLLSPRETEYTYAWDLFEMIALALPMQRTHALEDCNNEMLAHISLEDESDNGETEEK